LKLFLLDIYLICKIITKAKLVFLLVIECQYLYLIKL